MNIQVWLYSFIGALFVFHLVAVPALLMKRNDFVDVAWGPAFPMTVMIGAFFGLEGGLKALDTRSILILGLVILWALRLFFHIGFRNLFHTEEDIRYATWRKEWGKTAVWRSYLQVFVLQALIAYLFLQPVILGLASPSLPMGILVYVGLAIWIVGFLFESIGDDQLRRFKKNKKNKGKLMTSGLWSWTRHPNYFGEITQWWGIWLMVAELPYGWATIISPIAISYVIFKISGVSMMENLMKKRPGFAEYAHRTSIFFPMPPKN